MKYSNGIYRTMLVSPFNPETLDPVIVDGIKMKKLKGRHQVLEDVYVKVF